jgi:hypothetical protein
MCHVSYHDYDSLVALNAFGTPCLMAQNLSSKLVCTLEYGECLLELAPGLEAPGMQWRYGPREIPGPDEEEGDSWLCCS